MKFIVLGCAFALWTVGVHEHLIGEKGPSTGTILFVLCVSQYLDVSA